jgi:hypothetical protein
MRSGRNALGLVLILGLLAGPAEAACTDCCPRDDAAQPTTLSLPACCGNCNPSIDSSPTAAPVVAKATVGASDWTALVTRSAQPATALAVSEISAQVIPGAPAPRSGSLTPLRL